VVAEAVIAAHEHALLYLLGPEQALAYFGTSLGITVYAGTTRRAALAIWGGIDATSLTKDPPVLWSH
jgi:hypothetical protein